MLKEKEQIKQAEQYRETGEEADSQRRILLVDDNERELFVLYHTVKRMRTAHRHELVTAHGAVAALELLEQQSFDVLLTDLRMPTIGGVKLTELFVEANPDALVVWLTAYGCYHERDTAKRLGVIRCLDKPVEIGVIRDAVQEALDELDRREVAEQHATG